jgi:hypothetical protein
VCIGFLKRAHELVGALFAAGNTKVKEQALGTSVSSTHTAAK